MPWWDPVPNERAPRAVIVEVVDDRGDPVPRAVLTTPCGCEATTDDRGLWQGTEMPGPNGAIALSPGAVVTFEAHQIGYQTTLVELDVRRGQRRYVVSLYPLPPAGELDFDDFEFDHCFHWADERDDIVDTALGTSVFTPEPAEPAPPPKGWRCNKD